MDSKWIIRVVLAFAANGLLIAVAAAIFDKFAMTFTGWILATIVFTVITVALRGIATKIAAQYASQATWVGGLVLTFLALWVVDQISDEVYLEGGLTWILSTVIIWIGTVIYDRVDDKLVDEVGKAMGR